MKLLLSKFNIYFICLGTILVSLGVIFISIFSGIHEGIISGALEFSPDSKAFIAWKNPKSAIGMNIYFFNWTNHEDFKNPNIKPKFVEVGPYAFKQWNEKANITWNDVNKTITYRNLKHFFFDKENSVGSLTDEVISINVVAMVIAHKTNDWSLSQRGSYGPLLASATVYKKKNVRELLFDGYSDPTIEPHKFGWFNGRNNTVENDGTFNMGTSADDNFGKLKEWNFSNHTGFYDDHCGAITGSAGEFFTRNQSPTKIDLFIPDMCRSLQLNFVEVVTVNGIPCYKYAPGDEVFDNGTKISSNQCYCNGKCLPYGVLNISSCASDVPMFISLPHFYKADSSYGEAVDGISPKENKHELYVTLEPKSGVITEMATRMQVNLLVEPKSSYTLFQNVPTVMFPVFWFEQTELISDELLSGLTFPKFIKLISIFLIVVGLLIILFVILYATYYKQIRSKPKITKEELLLKSELQQK